MHDLIAFLKDVADRMQGSGMAGCYVARDGSIYARNQAMIAGVAMEADASFAVPADDLDAALARMKEVRELAIDEDTITLKGGRLRSTIRCVRGEPPQIPEQPEEWVPLPPGTIEAIGIARLFLGDHGWTRGIRLSDGRVTAMSNAAGVEVAVPGLLLAPSLLTDTVAAFLAAQGAPNDYAPEASGISFRWADGRWARAQLLTERMPDLEPIFAKAGKGTPISITQDMRDAYADAAALSDGTVTVSPGGFRALKGASTSDVDVPMGLPDGHASHWSIKVLDAVMACAVSWDPTPYPDPCLFLGPGLRGVAVGVRR